MSWLADRFGVADTDTCARVCGVANCPVKPEDTKHVCYRHTELGRNTILAWCGLSTFVGLLAGVGIMWANQQGVGYANAFSAETWQVIDGQIELLLEFTEWMIPSGLIFFLVWILAVLFVCGRKLTTLREYAVLGLVSPAFVVSIIAPLSG